MNTTQSNERRRKADSPAGRITAGEQLVTLTEAARLLPRVDGRKVAVCTLWRWCNRHQREDSAQSASKSAQKARKHF